MKPIKLSIIILLLLLPMVVGYNPLVIDQSPSGTINPGSTKFTVKYNADNINWIRFHWSDTTSGCADPPRNEVLMMGSKCPSGNNVECSTDVDLTSYAGKQIRYFWTITNNDMGVSTSCGLVDVLGDCTNDCSFAGQGQCTSTTEYKECGNYDSDSCLEWGSLHSCSIGSTCVEGACRSTCEYQCASTGQKTCADSSSYKTCELIGNCLKWSSASYCSSGNVCDNGVCKSAGPVCGNGACESGETCSSCSSDCRCSNYERCESGSCVGFCGNGRKDYGEDCRTCPNDVLCDSTCQSGFTEKYQCEGQESQREYKNKACKSIWLKDQLCLYGCNQATGKCKSAGPVCGNGACESGETCSSCSSDCRCSNYERCESGSCVGFCGNGRKEYGEDCRTCPNDVICDSTQTCDNNGNCIILGTTTLEFDNIDTDNSQGYGRLLKIRYKISNKQRETIQPLTIEYSITEDGITTSPKKFVLPTAMQNLPSNSEVSWSIDYQADNKGTSLSTYAPSTSKISITLTLRDSSKNVLATTTKEFNVFNQNNVLNTQVSQNSNTNSLTISSSVLNKNRNVIIETDKGTIKFEVFEDKAPITSKNFIELASSGFYNGLKFHRYVPGFVIQGGDPKGDGTGNSGKTIKLEIAKDLKHMLGTVAMARSSDPDSASSQFYITLADTPNLDGQYAVFGKVIEGMDVVMLLRQGDVIKKVSIDSSDTALSTQTSEDKATQPNDNSLIELSASKTIFDTLKAEVDKIKLSNADSALVSGSKNILTEMQNALSNAEEQIKQGKKEDALQSLQKIPELQQQFEAIKQNSTIPQPKTKAINLLSTNGTLLYRIIGVVAALLIIILLIFSYKKVRSVFKTGNASKEKGHKTEAAKTTQLKSYEHAIEVSDFTLNVKKTDILKDVSFKIRKGEMACLLGPSGTGKSTVIESLIGRKSPTKGNIKLLGEDIKKSKFIYDYVGFVPQHAELYNSQTVMQNMLNSAIKYNIKNAESKADKLLDKLSLSNRKSLKAGSLSGGQQKLLSLGMELIRDVELIILDEPTTGLDPNTRNSIMTTLTHISSQLHKTIFFTTHFMDDAEECDEVIILNNKKIVAQGHPTKLEKMLPGGGRVVNIILDNVTDDLIAKIEKIEDIEKVVREGRNLRIITTNPNAIKLGQKVDEIGGVVNETKIDKASMMDVFVYHTGEKLED